MLNKIKIYGGEGYYFIIKTEKTLSELFTEAEEKGYILIENDRVLIPFKNIFMIECLGTVTL